MFNGSLTGEDRDWEGCGCSLAQGGKNRPCGQTVQKVGKPGFFLGKSLWGNESQEIKMTKQ